MMSVLRFIKKQPTGSNLEVPLTSKSLKLFTLTI